ncbi:MAG TPA: carboxypeptidase-like regulatory domain-containing protein, partial [Chthoniobacterales bacterium]|nr:carboxypeptidase-like regulatory domain-containing protein [Chthoniobacterales bacterium]
WPDKTSRYVAGMKIIARTIIALVVAATSIAFGAVPQLNVIVSDSSGKAAYKGATDSKGAFATGALKPGNYVVQFTSKSGGMKGNTYALFISAGTKKVQAEAVAGEKFAGGGVAMKIEVGSGLNITGQFTSGLQSTAKLDKNGKKMVWIPKKTGSNLPAHWAPEDSAEAKEAKTMNTMSSDDVMKRQSQGVAMPGN